MLPLTIVSLLFGIAATAAGVMAVDRMHVMLTLTSSVSVSDLMLPVGHWLFAAVWMAIVAVMIRSSGGAGLFRGQTSLRRGISPRRRAYCDGRDRRDARPLHP